MKFEIKNRFSGKIIFTADTDSLKLAVELAVKQEVALDEADLRGVDLWRASLVNARLDGASLDGASLVNARLDGASLVNASLDGASLDGASLVNASLDGASLDGASLDGASLDGASLDGASLDPIRNDIWAVLALAPREVEALLAALKAGKVNGSVYEGECACLVGTIANARGCGYKELGDLTPSQWRPAERFFMAINKGDTPENSQFSALAVKWIEQWLASVKGAFTAAA